MPWTALHSPGRPPARRRGATNANAKPTPEDLLPTARSLDRRTMPRRERLRTGAIAVFRLLIFTGARLSEILTLRWAWIDLTQGVARLPDSKTGAKNLYLPPGALAVLEAAATAGGQSATCLPGDRPGGHFVGYRSLGNGFGHSPGCQICASMTYVMPSLQPLWQAATVCSSSANPRSPSIQYHGAVHTI